MATNGRQLYTTSQLSLLLIILSDTKIEMTLMILEYCTERVQILRWPNVLDSIHSYWHITYRPCGWSIKLQENILRKRLDLNLRWLQLILRVDILCKNKKICPKELNLCHRLWFYNPYIFATQCLRPYLFQTKYTVRSNNLSLKYQRFTPSGSKDIGI